MCRSIIYLIAPLQSLRLTMDDDDAPFDASGKPQPLVRKHYTSFNSIRNWLERSVHYTSARSRYLNPLQPHLSYLRYTDFSQDIATPFIFILFVLNAEMWQPLSAIHMTLEMQCAPISCTVE